MNRRLWSVVLVLILVGAGEVRSQPKGSPPRPDPTDLPERPIRNLPIKYRLQNPEDARPSHRIIKELEFNPSDEEGLLNRLKRFREGKEILKNKEIQQKVKELSQELTQKFKDDPEALRGMLNQDVFKQLQGKLEKGENLFSDPEIQKLVTKGEFKRALTEKEQELLKRWIEAFAKTEGMNPSENPAELPVNRPPEVVEPPVNPPVETPPNPSPPGETPPMPSDWVQEKMDKWANSLEDWALSPSGDSFRDSLSKLGRSPTAEALGKSFLDQARGLENRLPRLDRSLPRNWGWRNPNLPNLRTPNIDLRPPGVPSLPSFSARNASDGATVLLLIVGGIVVAVLLARMSWTVYQAKLANAWKLGPWPVKPQKVSSREELVRAFEHLALLCLGQTARTRHHLDLAEQLGAQPSPEPQVRREAAGLLARLYERARYAPLEESLPPEDLATARQQLCYLAGVETP